MFEQLEQINTRPEPFESYTAADLWTDEHTSKQMLAFHLNASVDVASRNAAFIDRSVEWIVSRCGVEAGARIADFGCGPGLYTTRLTKKGGNVTGIDFSKRSIQYAQNTALREGLPIRYICQNYLEYETDDRFDLILMIMCDFCALSPNQRKTMLNKFHTLLEPGGLLLIDVYSLAAFDKRQETARYEMNLLDGFWSPNKYFGFLNTFKYEAEKVILDKYTIVEAARTRTICNWLQYFTPAALRQEIESSGLAVEDLYANVAGDPFDPDADEFAVLVKRP
ncbi:MAG TPA: methyltransferase domain-containing protein [Anaerohalosphaeraceae bacterium]|jgi:2-polyprenyl-3-methyl-5-hydroxy-6-metoxy-1,4-benzoquinol methylase|nr:methyltransferase domain-containing protein [Anaerohalosphaeraceae bacterium]HRT51464.1 methyltransferase domain-containing protein [Anaerohalosphaeraceae bacterium]HRT87511.1 methyltransferase domain-containing protein [Anaerohalosphaeraceae bacterium]